MTSHTEADKSELSDGTVAAPATSPSMMPKNGHEPDSAKSTEGAISDEQSAPAREDREPLEKEATVGESVSSDGPFHPGRELSLAKEILLVGVVCGSFHHSRGVKPTTKIDFSFQHVSSQVLHQTRLSVADLSAQVIQVGQGQVIIPLQIIAKDLDIDQPGDLSWFASACS